MKTLNFVAEGDGRADFQLRGDQWYIKREDWADYLPYGRAGHSLDGLVIVSKMLKQGWTQVNRNSFYNYEV